MGKLVDGVRKHRAEGIFTVISSWIYDELEMKDNAWCPRCRELYLYKGGMEDPLICQCGEQMIDWNDWSYLWDQNSVVMLAYTGLMRDGSYVFNGFGIR